MAVLVVVVVVVVVVAVVVAYAKGTGNDGRAAAAHTEVVVFLRELPQSRGDGQSGGKEVNIHIGTDLFSFRWSLRVSSSGLYRPKLFNGWWAFRFFQLHKNVIGVTLRRPTSACLRRGNLVYIAINSCWLVGVPCQFFCTMISIFTLTFCQLSRVFFVKLFFFQKSS